MFVALIIVSTVNLGLGYALAMLLNGQSSSHTIESHYVTPVAPDRTPMPVVARPAPREVEPAAVSEKTAPTANDAAEDVDPLEEMRKQLATAFARQAEQATQAS